MIELLFKYAKPVKIFVIVTFINALLNLNRNKKNNLFLIAILAICSLTELINPILKYIEISNSLFITISIILHHFIWLVLLKSNMILKKSGLIFIIIFIAFGFFNLIFLSGFFKFNYYTFVAGALIYILLFIWESFYRLKEENLLFFFSNTYILLCAPVLFFFGYSFMFAFSSKELTDKIIFGNLMLYDFISCFVNVLLYTLLNIYIYREKKFQYA